MLATLRKPIDRQTTGELTKELAELGAQLMVGTLRELANHRAVRQNDAEATHAPKIDKSEARIDWSEDAETIERKIRALAPFPGAWFELEGERIKLLMAEVVDPRQDGTLGEVLDTDLAIACGSGALRPLRLQRAGKPAMDRAEFLRGRPVAQGTQLA